MKTRNRTRQMETEWITFGALILALLVGAPAGLAAEVAWTGDGGNANWSTTANWTGGVVPDESGEAASFNTATNRNVTVDTDVTVDSIQFFAADYQLSGSNAITLSPNPGAYGFDDQITWYSGADNSDILCDIVLAGDVSIYQNNNDGTNFPIIGGTIGEDQPGRTLTFTDGRQISLRGDNSYSGGTVSQGITLELGHVNALGTGDFTIEAHTRLWGTQDIAIDNNISLENSLWLGPFAPSKNTITLNGGISIDASGTSITEYDQDATERLEVMGTITDNGNGLTLNSYQSGEILIGGANAITGGVTVVNGNGKTETFTVAENTAFGTSGVTFQNTNGAGSVTLAPETGTGTGTVTINNDVTLDLGTTDLILGGNSETIILNSQISGTGNLEVGDNAVLAGTGSITGNVTVNAGGALAPGNSPGNMTISGDLTFAGGTSNYIVDLLDATAGSGYDQVTVNGAIGLNYAPLELIIADTPRFLDDDLAFIMINNGESVLGSGTGRFAGLGNGTTIDLAAFGGPADSSAQISYFGDYVSNSATGGNDIVLYNFTNAFIPEPSTFAVIFLSLVSLMQRRKRR